MLSHGYQIECQHITGGLPLVLLRGGATAAVAPQKRQCEIERLYPAGSLVGAAAAPSRSDVSSNAWATLQRTKPENIEKIE